MLVLASPSCCPHHGGETTDPYPPAYAGGLDGMFIEALSVSDGMMGAFMQALSVSDGIALR